MSEKLTCEDCGSRTDIVRCSPGVFLCLVCVNALLRSRNAQHAAQEDYEIFLDQGGRVS
jgi:hypothetical protein